MVLKLLKWGNRLEEDLEQHIQEHIFLINDMIHHEAYTDESDSVRHQIPTNLLPILSA